MREFFEEFCKEYNLDYDLTLIGNSQYGNKHTMQAFIIFKYSMNWRRES